MFPFDHRGHVVIQDPPTTDVATSRLRTALGAFPHVHARVAGHRLSFDRAWRADASLKGRYEPMMLVDSGELTIVPSGRELRVEYRLRFVRAAWIVLVVAIVAMTIAALTNEGPPPPLGRMLVFLPIAWMLGFGMIRYRAHAFVPGWLSRSAMQPED